MVRALLTVLTVLVVYAFGKVVSHFWRMTRTFRGLPRHPKKHWFYGHANLVRYSTVCDHESVTHACCCLIRAWPVVVQSSE